MEKALSKLHKLDTEIYLLRSIYALLIWDQETYMPARAVDERAEQLSLLEGSLHQKSTNPELGELLSALGADDTHPAGKGLLAETEQAFTREMYRMYTRSRKLPQELVMELAREKSKGLAQWVKAREESAFSLFAPNLAKLVELTRQKAACLGYTGSIYDPLLDEYEPWMQTSELDLIFDQLLAKQKPLVEKIIGSRVKARPEILGKNFDVRKQEEFSRFLLQKTGFDFNSGRLDISAHSFTIAPGSHDVRLTNRYTKNMLGPALFGALHEGGHGLYQMGFSPAIARSLLANGVSMGIHESQSLFWENCIGHSLPFWEAFYPELQKFFPLELADAGLADFYAAINHVEFSLIRVEADEVTYNLHILLRYKLEKQLVSGELQTADLPAAWRKLSREYLGLEPPSDAAGVLQDIHWSQGDIGYFPTYTLGNLYSAQFYQAMKKALPGVEDEIRRGNLQPVLAWLRGQIHCHGSIYPAGELCRRVTGEKLNPDYFIDYLTNKYLA